MDIIREAQEYFRKKGIDQWQNNYPNIETIKMDMRHDNSYVFVKDNLIVGTVALTFDREKSYENIVQGSWKSAQDYGAIHRIAVAHECRGMGISSIIIEDIEKICLNRGIHSIRVDTHKDNTPMQKLLEKNKFQYCGIIYLEDGGERLAFEKIL